MRVLGLAAINRDLICKMPHEVVDVEDATDNVDNIIKLENYARENASLCVECLGGSVINTLYVPARCGIEVHIVGRVGNDEVGRFLINKMHENKLTFIGKIVAGGLSGRTVVLSGISSRQILVYPGVNDYVNVEDLRDLVSREYVLVHTSTFACVLSDSPIDAQVFLFREYSNSIRSLMFGSLYCKLLKVDKTRDKILTLLRYCDVLFLNKSEAEMLIGSLDVYAIKSFACKYNVRIVCVTLGPEGVLVLSDNKILRERSLATYVVDTTGAGDAFAGGFLLGLVRGYEIDKCMLLGLHESARCLQHYCGTEYSVKCEI